MSVKHIGDLKKTECYGCSACVYSCPFGAITMEQDREGFRYPVVDEEKCVACGKCVKACPKHLVVLKPASKKTSVQKI